MLPIQKAIFNLRERHIKSLSGNEKVYCDIQDKSASYIVWMIIAIEKGFSILKIAFSDCFFLQLSHHYFLWYSGKLIFHLRWGRSKWADISMSVPQLQVGLIGSRKLCLNSCSRRWLKPSLILVNNLTPLRLF